MKFSVHDLAQRQSLPLDAKVWHSQKVVREWYDANAGHIYVSFSGGKDSTALLHLVRGIYPDTPAVFFNTGNEYPEVAQFVRSCENITWVNPQKPFAEVIARAGYPVISKQVSQYVYDIRHCKPNSKTYSKRMANDGIGHLSQCWRFLLDAPFEISDKCCSYLKKAPARSYERQSGNKPMTGMMAANSMGRRIEWLKHGCNAFDKARPISNPLSIWTDEDVWEYLHANNIPYCGIYDCGYRTTGCAWCLFGAGRDSYPNRIQRMQETHPQMWEYGVNTLGFGAVCEWIGFPYRLDDHRSFSQVIASKARVPTEQMEMAL